MKRVTGDTTAPTEWSGPLKDKPIPEPPGHNFTQMTQGQVAEQAQAAWRDNKLPDTSSWGPNSLKTLRQYYAAEQERESGSLKGDDRSAALEKAHKMEAEIDERLHSLTDGGHHRPATTHNAEGARDANSSEPQKLTALEIAAASRFTPDLYQQVAPPPAPPAHAGQAQAPIARNQDVANVVRPEPGVKHWGDRHEAALAPEGTVHEKSPVEGFDKEMPNQKIIAAAQQLASGGHPDISKFGSDATDALNRQLRFDLKGQPVTSETLSAVDSVQKHKEEVQVAGYAAIKAQRDAALNPNPQTAAPPATHLTLDQLERLLTHFGMEQFDAQNLRSLDDMAQHPKDAAESKRINDIAKKFKDKYRNNPSEYSQYQEMVDDILQKTAPPAPAQAPQASLNTSRPSFISAPGNFSAPDLTPTYNASAQGTAPVTPQQKPVIDISTGRKNTIGGYNAA